jgi:hypothetical protein
MGYLNILSQAAEDNGVEQSTSILGHVKRQKTQRRRPWPWRIGRTARRPPSRAVWEGALGGSREASLTGIPGGYQVPLDSGW